MITWNGEKSIVLSKWCVMCFMGLLLLTAIFAPWLVRIVVYFAESQMLFFLTTVYLGVFPAAYLLFHLLLLLRRIEQGQVFIEANVESLRRISWSCFVGTAIALVSSVYYVPWIFLAIAAAFIGLIVRVVKNVVAQAVALQDEVDCTI